VTAGSVPGDHIFYNSFCPKCGTEGSLFRCQEGHEITVVCKKCGVIGSRIDKHNKAQFSKTGVVDKHSYLGIK